MGAVKPLQGSFKVGTCCWDNCSSVSGSFLSEAIPLRIIYWYELWSAPNNSSLKTYQTLPQLFSVTSRHCLLEKFNFCDYNVLCILHDECKQGIDQQIFDAKSISRKITHPQSLFKWNRESIPCLPPSWGVHTCVQICVSLNPRTKVKAERSRLIPRRHTENLVALPAGTSSIHCMPRTGNKALSDSTWSQTCRLTGHRKAATSAKMTTPSPGWRQRRKRRRQRPTRR